MTKDIFTKTYLNIIKEDYEEESFNMDEQTGEFEREYRREGEGRYEGDYIGLLYGTIHDGVIDYEGSIYSTAMDQELLDSDEFSGTKEIGEGQTANMILSNLWREFVDLVDEQDITQYMASDEEMGIESDEQEDWG